MKCEFSETQYLLGVGREILDLLTPNFGWGPPLIPTQIEEATSGYDFSINHPIRTLFIQFKVPEKLTRSNAKYWSCFNGPYYRNKIMKLTDSNQHNLLVSLANNDTRNNVIYLSPIFHTNDKFRDYYVSKTIMRNSIAMNCRDLNEIIDDKQHYLAYNENPNRYYMFSKPEEAKGELFEKYISKAQQNESYDGINDFIESVSSSLDKKKINLEKIEKTQDKILAISEYLAIQENIFMYLF